MGGSRVTELEDEMFEVRRESFQHIDEVLIHLAANAPDGSRAAITRELLSKGLRRDEGVIANLYEIRKVAEQRIAARSG